MGEDDEQEDRYSMIPNNRIILNWKLIELNSHAFLMVGYYINKEFPVNARELQMEKGLFGLGLGFI